MENKLKGYGERIVFRWDLDPKSQAVQGLMWLRLPEGKWDKLSLIHLIAYRLHIGKQKGNFVWTASQTEQASRLGWYISRDWRCRRLLGAQDITEEIKQQAESGDPLAIAAVVFLMSRKLNGNS